MNFQRSKKATKKDLILKFSLKTTVGLNTAVNHRQKRNFVILASPPRGLFLDFSSLFSSSVGS